MLSPLSLDLSRAPADRWSELSRLAREAAELTDSYVSDLGGIDEFAPLIAMYRQSFVSAEYGAELDAIAKIIDRDPQAVLVANLYYDAMHAMLGCTAFAIDTPTGPLHARNLDWWTEKNMLSKYTLVVECARGVGPYQIVGWPGFIGVYSAVAKGRFAITLNAVISDDKPQLAESITLLLRKIFDTAVDFDAALQVLIETPIAADCLLLITGTAAGEMAVIERTPTRAEMRVPQNGIVVVTNDYRALEGWSGSLGDLHATCARFDQALSMALRHHPQTPSACFDILQHDKVKMLITVQHMVMQASTGLLEVRLPEVSSFTETQSHIETAQPRAAPRRS